MIRFHVEPKSLPAGREKRLKPTDYIRYCRFSWTKCYNEEEFISANCISLIGWLKMIYMQVSCCRAVDQFQEQQTIILSLQPIMWHGLRRDGKRCISVMNQSLICLGQMAEGTFVEEQVKHCHQNALKRALRLVEEASWFGGWYLLKVSGHWCAYVGEKMQQFTRNWWGNMFCLYWEMQPISQSYSCRTMPPVARPCFQGTEHHRYRLACSEPRPKPYRNVWKILREHSRAGNPKTTEQLWTVIKKNGIKFPCKISKILFPHAV